MDMVGMRNQIFYVFKVSVFGVLRSPSDSPWPVDIFSRPEIAVRVEKVGCTAETLSVYNFGPNVVFETLGCKTKIFVFSKLQILLFLGPHIVELAERLNFPGGGLWGWCFRLVYGRNALPLEIWPQCRIWNFGLSKNRHAWEAKP